MQAKGHQPDILCAISYAVFYFWKAFFCFVFVLFFSIQASSKLFAAEDCFLLFAAHRFRVQTSSNTGMLLKECQCLPLHVLKIMGDL